VVVLETLAANLKKEKGPKSRGSGK
jgi:hypothetical protein